MQVLVLKHIREVYEGTFTCVRGGCERDLLSMLKRDGTVFPLQSALLYLALVLDRIHVKLISRLVYAKLEISGTLYQIMCCKRTKPVHIVICSHEVNVQNSKFEEY